MYADFYKKSKLRSISMAKFETAGGPHDSPRRVGAAQVQVCLRGIPIPASQRMHETCSDAVLAQPGLQLDENAARHSNGHHIRQ
ncbi:unnamed protein product, partial [Ectocarpus sp. 13 AM-2016]